MRSSDELRGDAGVVDAGQPQRVVAAHAVVADEDVLDERGERVAEVERAGDVRRRLDDDEPLGARGSLVGRAERIGRQPSVVDRRLDGGGVVARGKLASRRHRSVSSSAAATANPFVEGRTGRGTTFVRDRRGGRLVSRAIGRTRPARVRPFPRSVPGWAPSRWPALSEGRVEVLLTVTAVPRSLAPPPAALSADQRARSSVTTQPPSGRGSTFAPSPSSCGDRGRKVEAGTVRGAEDELAGLAEAERDAIDAVDAGRAPGGSR